MPRTFLRGIFAKKPSRYDPELYIRQAHASKIFESFVLAGQAAVPITTGEALALLGDTPVYWITEEQVPFPDYAGHLHNGIIHLRPRHLRKWTVLHEMTHLKCGLGHDQTFFQEVCRLYQAHLGVHVQETLLERYQGCERFGYFDPEKWL